MPTNLGALPTNQVLPNVRSAINRGGNYGAYGLDNGWAIGSWIPDGVASGYPVTRTCNYPCYLVADLQILITGTRAAWDYANFSVRIDPADLDGIVVGNYCIAPLNNALGWRTYHCTYPFRCGVGTYTIFASWEGSNGPVIHYWIMQKNTHLHVEQVGESVV